MSPRAAAVVACSLACIPEAAGADLEEIVVTGTRLAGSGSDAIGLLVSLTPDDFRHPGPGGLGEWLQQLPASTGSPANSGFNASGEGQGGDGSVQIDLRGLGPERTLVLLDGRRLVYGGGGGDAAADLGMIPLSLVERVEVLGSGTAAIHGADAVAGVVNIITRRSAPTSAGSAEIVLTDHGDGGGVRLSAIGEWGGADAGLLGGLEWYRQEEVWMEDRRYSRQRETLADDGKPVALGLAQTPLGYFRVPAGNVLGLPAGIYTRSEESTDPASAEDFRPFVEPLDRYNPNDDEYLTTPYELASLWLKGRRDLDGAVELAASALLNHRESAQMLRPASVDTRFGIGIPRLPSGRPGIPSDNVYNPFGVNMADVRRRVVEAGRREFEQSVNMAQLQFSARGRSTAGWTWEAGAGWSRSQLRQTTRGELRADRLALALGPSGLDGDGNLACGASDPGTGRISPDEVIPGCVPLNVFGGMGADGAGTISREQLAYVTDDFVDRGRNEHWLLDLTGRGRAGALPGGPVEWALGAEYRKLEGFEKLDPAKSSGTTGSVTGGLTTQGAYDVVEAFGEARLPFATDGPWAELIALDAGLRVSSYSSFGTTTNGSARLLWQPAAPLGFRAAYATVFRAPPLQALYASEVPFFSIARDPCGNDPTAEQQIHCAANGVPGGAYLQPPLDEVATVRGGNPDLDPEDGRTWSTGLTIAMNDDASIAVDYWDVEINSAIRQLRDQTILEDCANSGAAATCGLITRASDGSVTRVDARYLNVGRETARGVDFEIRHALDWHRGQTRLRALGSWLSERSLQTSVAATSVALEGRKFERALFPRWRGLVRLDHEGVRWSAGYSLQYIGAATECNPPPPLLPGLMTGCRDIDDVLYHDFTLRFSPVRRLDVELAVTNLTDEVPPRVAFGFAEGNTSTTTYRLLGRTFGVRVGYELE